MYGVVKSEIGLRALGMRWWIAISGAITEAFIACYGEEALHVSSCDATEATTSSVVTISSLKWRGFTDL
jgi:hypothetical protein